MTRLSARRFACLLPLSSLGLLVVGCSPASVARTDVEQGVADSMEAQYGQRPMVSCDDDLPGEVGSTIRCELTADDGSTIGATVETTGVDGSDVEYSVVVDG